MAANYVFSFATAAPPPAAGSVVVSEVYGGGGNAGATLTNDFIELYNRTGVADQPRRLVGAVRVGGRHDLAGHAARPARSRPARTTSSRRRPAPAARRRCPRPTRPGSIAMSATAGKVALVSNTTALTGALPDRRRRSSTSSATARPRTASRAPGPRPRRATRPPTSARAAARPTRTTTPPTSRPARPIRTPPPTRRRPSRRRRPANGATGVALDANVVDHASASRSTSPAAGSRSAAPRAARTPRPRAAARSTFTLDPAANFARQRAVHRDRRWPRTSTDQDTDDPPDTMAANYVFSFPTADVLVCGGPARRRSTTSRAAGSRARSSAPASRSRASSSATTRRAGEFGGYYLQEEAADADANPATSEGVFVFANGFGPDVAPATSSACAARSPSSTASPRSAGDQRRAGLLDRQRAAGAPTPVSLPVASLDDLERFEGMLVSFSQTLTATEVFNLGRFGEVSLSATGRLYTPTAVATPGARRERAVRTRTTAAGSSSTTATTSRTSTRRATRRAASRRRTRSASATRCRG